MLYPDEPYEEREYRPLDLEAVGLTDCDWKRLAHPQDDHYDTDIFARIAEWRYGWKVRDWPAEVPTWLNGRVLIEEKMPILGDTPNVVIREGDERWEWVRELAGCWPAQLEQFRRLVNSVGTSTRPLGADGRAVFSCGSQCGTPPGNPFMFKDRIRSDHWGRIYTTMLSGAGFLEGMCHELAHWKGYTLGIYIEEWEHLIFANDPPAREWIDKAPTREQGREFDAETRRLWLDRGIGWQPFNQRMRPLGACFQEIWVMIHMIEYHLRMWPMICREGGFPGSATPITFKEWAVFHVERTMRGHRDLIEVAKPTPKIGEAFWEGYCSWVDGLHKQAEETWGMKF